MSHELHEALDNDHDMRIDFMDMSKAFIKVWNKGVIFKLKKERDRWIIVKVVYFILGESISEGCH